MTQSSQEKQIASPGENISPVGDDTIYFERDRGVTRVQVNTGVAHVTVDLPGVSLAADRLALLQSFAAANVPVFLVKLHPTGISFALREDQVDAGAALLQQRGVAHTFLRDHTLVTVVAGAMRDLSGVMAAIYEALVRANVPVRQTGDAYNAVICLVSGENGKRAAVALRECFSLPPEASAEPETGSGVKPL